MKNKCLILVIISLFTTACAVKIPLQANLSEQTMLLAKNKNLKADYVLISDVLNGPIDFVTIQRNGKEFVNNNEYEYDSETAFLRIWNSYFSSKFNSYSEETIEIDVILLDLYLVKTSSTSIGENILTGNSKYNIEAVAEFEYIINYKGKTYGNKFEVNSSEYNESQLMSGGDVFYTETLENPTRQKAKLLESCFNRSIIQFENFINLIVFDMQ